MPACLLPESLASRCMSAATESTLLSPPFHTHALSAAPLHPAPRRASPPPVPPQPPAHRRVPVHPGALPLRRGALPCGVHHARSRRARMGIHGAGPARGGAVLHAGVREPPRGRAGAGRGAGGAGGGAGADAEAGVVGDGGGREGGILPGGVRCGVVWCMGSKVGLCCCTVSMGVKQQQQQHHHHHQQQ